MHTQHIETVELVGHYKRLQHKRTKRGTRQIEFLLLWIENELEARKERARRSVEAAVRFSG